MNRRLSFVLFYLALVLTATAGILSLPREFQSPRAHDDGELALVTAPSSDVFAKDSRKSERVTQVLLGDEFRVTSEKGKWAYGHIPSQRGYQGWIMKKDILFTAKDSPFRGKALVRVETARTKVSLGDGSSLNVYAGTRLPLLQKTGDHYEVMLPNGSTGLLALDSASREDEQLGKTVTAEDIIRAAELFRPNYRWGGITPGSMDCSGFVYTVFRINGIYLKRDSHMQAEEGMDISLSELNKGDLVFFKSGKGNRIGHVGIYVGQGNFIHSSRSKRGICISSLTDSSYRKAFVMAKRMLSHVDGTVWTDEAKYHSTL